MGVVSVKVGVVKQTCGPPSTPQKNILYETLPNILLTKFETEVEDLS